MSLKASYWRVPPPVLMNRGTTSAIAKSVTGKAVIEVKSSLSSLIWVVAATCWLTMSWVRTPPTGWLRFSEVIVRVSSWICVGLGKEPGALRLVRLTTPVRGAPTSTCAGLVCGAA